MCLSFSSLSYPGCEAFNLVDRFVPGDCTVSNTIRVSDIFRDLECILIVRFALKWNDIGFFSVDGVFFSLHSNLSVNCLTYSSED